jgi:putative ABC transport system substrate-binding protein
MTSIRAGLTVVLALGLLAAPLAAGAQHAARIYRLGFLGAASASSYIPARSEEFEQGLRDLGFVKRGNLTIEYRWAGGQEARLADLAAELVRLKVEVIVAADQEAARVARGVTTRIPIVTVSDGDPAWRRLIARRNRPPQYRPGSVANGSSC